jgi:hypothetical protein
LQGASGDLNEAILRDEAQWTWHARFSATTERSCGPSGTRPARSVWHQLWCLAPALVSGTSPGALVCDLDPAVALTLLVRKNP